MKRILPSYPLWIIDPMFSVWSSYDTLNGGDTTFWTGLNHRAYGFVRYNGKTYCFMGKRDDCEILAQTGVSISAFSTRYTFECNGFKLSIEFVSPRKPDDLRLLSCPICFTEYEVMPKSGKLPDDFSIALAMDEEFCYNGERAETVGGVLPMQNCEAAFFNRRRNLVLSDTTDMAAPDWGTTYLTGEESFFITDTALNRYIYAGELEYLRKAEERNYIVSLNRTPSGYFVTAFDDYVSIFYFGEWLKGYFFKDGETITDAIEWARDNHDKILAECNTFDNKLKVDCEKVGRNYYVLACAALRQSVAAHKLVQNKKGELLFLSKECNSNGCICKDNGNL